MTLTLADKHVLSEDEKKTQEYVCGLSCRGRRPANDNRYDKLAFRYVSYVTIPLLAGYTVYSLIYETHRGCALLSLSTSFPLWLT